MCMYSHAIVGVSPHDYGRAMVGYICPTHTVSVTYKLGVTAAGMIIPCRHVEPQPFNINSRNLNSMAPVAITTTISYTFDFKAYDY